MPKRLAPMFSNADLLSSCCTDWADVPLFEIECQHCLYVLVALFVLIRWCVLRLQVWICVYVHIHICAFTYVCALVYRTWLNLFVCTVAGRQFKAFVRTACILLSYGYTYIYTHLHTNIHLHINTHIHIPNTFTSLHTHLGVSASIMQVMHMEIRTYLHNPYTHIYTWASQNQTRESNARFRHHPCPHAATSAD